VRLSFSRTFPFVSRRRYFCNEPWLGTLAVEVDQEVTFCQCYLKMNLGNLREQSLEELWNAPKLVALRRDFRKGRLPSACRNQVCPPARGAHTYLSTIPDLLPETHPPPDPPPGPA
jgi:MoaA/NifB/PqqE/SkfB family radical SAM enzyme